MSAVHFNEDEGLQERIKREEKWRAKYVLWLIRFGVLFVANFVLLFVTSLGGDGSSFLTQYKIGFAGETFISFPLIITVLWVLYDYYDRVKRAGERWESYSNDEIKAAWGRHSEAESAKVDAGVSHSGGQRDIGYYFDLLQRGAITQDEYDAKKAELL